MRIGILAQRSDCLVETIRYYEREGLLPPPARSSGNFREYTETHAERLQFIRACRSLDMTLDEIRILLRVRDTPEDSCAAVNALLDEHMQHVATRIEALRSLEIHLRHLRQCCDHAQASKDCGILNELVHTPTKQGVLSKHGHVHGTH